GAGLLRRLRAHPEHERELVVAGRREGRRLADRGLAEPPRRVHVEVLHEELRERLELVRALEEGVAHVEHGLAPVARVEARQPAPAPGAAAPTSTALIVWKGCSRDIQILHRIVTHDTPRARDLHGKLTIRATGGDPATIRILRVSRWPVPILRQYTLGTPIAV